MKNESHKPANVDEYITAFSPHLQAILQQVRSTIRKWAPKAEEIISYGIPAYRYNNSPLVYFAGFKNHIGFYALPSGSEAFKKELTTYKVGKGSIQFPLDKQVPLDLIARIVRYRIEEIEQKQKGR
jgi:uncharacterized protein YdhG (YjbR/CyaY superfamily)